MKWAALITWVLTAGGGFVLLSIWLARGGMKSQAAGNRIKPPLIMSHFLLAATGLVLWIVYVVNDSSTLAWIAFVLLLVVALLGFTMFGIWLRRRQAGAGGDDAGHACRTALPDRDRRPARPARGDDARPGAARGRGRRR